MKPSDNPYGHPSKEYLERYKRECWFCAEWNFRNYETEPCNSCIKDENTFHPNFTKERKKWERNT